LHGVRKRTHVCKVRTLWINQHRVRGIQIGNHLPRPGDFNLPLAHSKLIKRRLQLNLFQMSFLHYSFSRPVSTAKQLLTHKYFWLFENIYKHQNDLCRIAESPQRPSLILASIDRGPKTQHSLA
jgi:hypothetical protein